MVKIIDPRVIEGKENRNNSVRKMFNDMACKHLTTEYIIDEIIKKFGLSETTVMRILKNYGSYAKKNTTND